MNKCEVNWVPSIPNEALLDEATKAVQAQEQLMNAMRDQRSSVKPQLFEKCGQVLDEIRDVKSNIDGTAVGFVKTSVDMDYLANQLRPLVLMNLPETLTDEVKEKMTEIIHQSFNGTCNRILMIALVSCPWYRSTQNDRGLAAKHNVITVVYKNHDKQFFAPINPHIREQSEVIDEGWFYAVELFHFSHNVLKGRPRFVELLFIPDKAIVYQNDDWKSIDIDRNLCIGLRGFFEQCRGQAVGAVGKKKKSGHFRMRDAATLFEFCESFRLLHHASMVLSEHQLCLDFNVGEDSPGIAQTASKMMLKAYQDEDMSKQLLFDTVMEWRSIVDSQASTMKFTQVPQVENQLGRWMHNVRGKNFMPKHNDFSSDNLKGLLEKIGGPVASMSENDILMVVRAGSYLYGLDTPTSDIDYLVIYRTPTKVLLESCNRISESVEKRGPKLMCEYGAYEARLFTEMLWKCSVVILEVVFADGLEYVSPEWEAFTSHRQVFLTERAINQYFGLIHNNLMMLRNGRYKDNPGRERKLFYQIFHKLWSLEFFLKREIPKVRCSGETKEFIMNIRTGELTGSFCRDCLLKKAEEDVKSMRKRLAARDRRLPENVDYDFLLKWLLLVREWTLETGD